MRNVIKSVLMSALTVMASGLLIAATGQQSQEPNASPQQGQPSAQGQASSNAVVQSVTGCVVKSDQGFSLKTESDTYPIETGKDLSQYVNKKVKVTGILEHHTASAPPGASASTTEITDLRLRMILTVVGDCNQPQK